MSYQNATKYLVPALTAALLILVAAWAFNLPPVSALTDRSSEPLELTLQSNGQITGFPYDVVQVSGQGAATGTPDLAQLRLSVQVTSDTAVDAWTTAAQKMTAVRDSLTTNGVEETDIGTSRIRIRPDYDYGDDGRMLIGYTATNGLNVTIRDTGTVGTILDAAVTAGGDDIRLDDLDYQISDTTDLERDARADAVQNMEAKAQQIAASSGRTLGNLKVVSEFPGVGIGGGEQLFAAAAFVESALYDTPVSTGEETITVSVYGVYELR